MKRISAALSAILTCTSLGQVSAQTAPSLPPYEGVYQPKGVDEIGLWREDDESERKLAASVIVIRDEKLTAYVKQVLCDAVGQDRCSATRVYIVREPTFNATMSPNGTMRVYSGLLLRVRNEAELAAILGHEFGHFERRHRLAQFKSLRTGTDLLAWGALLTSMAPSYNAQLAYNNLELSIFGGFFRYGRDQEREADLLGLGYLNQGKFRPQAASVVWQNFMAEMEASAFARGLKKPKFDRIAFTASHPPHAERAAYLAALAAPGGSTREDGAERYREAFGPWLFMFLDDQIKLNDFGASDYIIQSLAETGWTPGLWLARGELYRARGNQRDLVHATEFYSNALNFDPSLANAYRGLGLSLLKTGHLTEGQAALRKYLKLKPDASDSAMISMMIPKEDARN